MGLVLNRTKGETLEVLRLGNDGEITEQLTIQFVEFDRGKVTVNISGSNNLKVMRGELLKEQQRDPEKKLADIGRSRPVELKTTKEVFSDLGEALRGVPSPNSLVNHCRVCGKVVPYGFTTCDIHEGGQEVFPPAGYGR